MPAVSVCHGCGLALPSRGRTSDPRLNASPECWEVQAEVVGFELGHVVQLGRFHQLMVDAYGAQHAPRDAPERGVPNIRVAYSLVGLFLAIEGGLGGPEVRAAHQRLGKPNKSWPAFARPSDVGAVTVLHVAKAGVRAESVPGHAHSVQRWARSVWHAWSGQHGDVAALTARILGNTFSFRA